MKGTKTYAMSMLAALYANLFQAGVEELKDDNVKEPTRGHRGGGYHSPTKKNKEESKARRVMAAKSRRINRRK